MDKGSGDREVTQQSRLSFCRAPKQSILYNLHASDRIIIYCTLLAWKPNSWKLWIPLAWRPAYMLRILKITHNTSTDAKRLEAVGGWIPYVE
jgi:hypothetical protein